MTERPCACGLPEKWAKDPRVPVRFDARTNEFSIVYESRGQGEWVMRYGPSCGGSMPESRRGSLFTEPDDAEVGEITELMRGVGDVAAMREVLGEPDQISDWDSTEELEQEARLYGTQRWTRAFTYGSRWTSLVLFVHEFEDGSVTYGYHGRYKGDSEG
jgi:hypothetical protein